MMRTIVVSFLVLLLTGCGTVNMVDKYQQSSLTNTGFERQTLALKEGGELHYWQGGDTTAPAIFLLHGFGGTGMTSWYDIMKDLSADYHVIVPDLLWFGESFNDTPATISSETQAIQQLISSLDLNSVNVVGISFGGFVTFDLMINEPKVNKTVMLASPGIIFSDEDMLAMSKRFGADEAKDVFVPKNGTEVRLLLENTFVSFPWLPSFIDTQVYQQYFESYHTEKESLITTLPAYRDQLITTGFEHPLPPSLLIWGANDQVFLLDNGQRFAEFLNAPLVLIPDGAHGLSNDFPEKISSEIRAFIQ